MEKYREGKKMENIDVWMIIHLLAIPVSKIQQKHKKKKKKLVKIKAQEIDDDDEHLTPV